jgi:hypothetical protein
MINNIYTILLTLNARDETPIALISYAVKCVLRVVDMVMLVSHPIKQSSHGSTLLLVNRIDDKLPGAPSISTGDAANTSARVCA